MTFLKNLSGFLRIEHTFFSLPVIFAGAFLAAGGIFSARIFVLIVLAGTGARTAALALNRIFDREIDRENPRTEKRELPSGKISMGEAVAVAAGGALLYFFSAYLICPLVFLLSPASACGVYRLSTYEKVHESLSFRRRVLSGAWPVGWMACRQMFF